MRPASPRLTVALLLTAFAAPAIGQTTTPATPPAAGSPSTAAAATTSAKTFVATVAVANLFEIESSQLALSRSRSSDVKEFASRMVTDHKMAGTKFKKAVTEARLTMPPEKLDAKHQAELDKLKSSSGEAFDKAYIEAQYKAHTEAVDLMRAYMRDGDTPHLKAFAGDMLPTLEGHLNHVNKLRNR
jgi:putative membrane protein